MHLFEVIAVDGSTLPVFAADFDEAAALFMAWHVATHASPLPDIEVRQRNPRWPGLNSEHLLEALARSTPGIGRYDPTEGWEITYTLDRLED